MYLPKSPLVLSIEITDRCNLKCRHCLADSNSKGRDMPKETVLSVIDEAKRIGTKVIILGGGEPLLYEDFFDIAEYVLIKELNLFFVTNGTLVPEKIKSFLRIQKYNNLFQVGVSLDGHTPEIHSYFRPKETFWSAIEAINLLNKAGIKISVLCVLNKENIKIIPEYLKFLSEFHVMNVRLLPFLPLGRGKECKEEMLSADGFYHIIKEKKLWKKDFKNTINFSVPWEFLFLPPEKRYPAPCEAGYLRLWINSNGDIFPCSYMADISIGNIHRDSIGDVWNNSPMLKALRDPTLLKGPCATCAYRDGCRGGCRGLAYFLEGDYLCSDPYCPIVVQGKETQA